MKSRMNGRLIIGMGLCLGAAILGRYGLNGPDLVATLACVFATVWLAKQLGLTRATDHASVYELNLLARLDNPNPAVRKQAEIERELYNWQQFHRSGTQADALSRV